MLIGHIKENHIKEAAALIDLELILSQFLNGIYWVEVNGEEYPFKYLVRIAHSLTAGHEDEWLNFQSKEECRDYICGLGFPIKRKSNKTDFFTKGDIELLIKVARSPYKKDEFDHQQYSKQLIDGVWKKTKYWFDLVLSEMDDFTGTCHKIWQERGKENGKTISVFKHYTWARIFKKANETKDIYFTVGVGADEKALIFKLDYEFRDKSRLSTAQKELCDRLIHENPIYWNEIPLADLKDYTWERLLDETVSFFTAIKSDYNSIIEEVWQINQKRIARMAWNSNGWVMPSGPYGKSEHEDSHEATYGYGHEEWLFDTGKLIDGYHYGFLEPIRKEQAAFENRTFDVWLYTIDGISKKRYWVGEIKNLEVIDTITAAEIKQIYINNGWLNEMEQQILASGANNNGFSNWNGVDLFNVRFLPADLNVNDPYFELPLTHPVYNQSRYAFVHFRNDFNIGNIEEGEFSFIPPTPGDEDKDDEAPESKFHQREPKLVEINLLHRKISKRLTKKLRDNFGWENVKPEHPAGYGASRIDIVVSLNNELTFYEIKTYATLRTSIREAVGQLFEYSLWPDQQKANRLIVVTQPHKNIDIEEAKVYFQHLREIYNLNIYYQYYDLGSNILSEEY